jgi:zeta-carotene desaturase
MPPTQHIAVIGGGLAGLAAGLRLAQAGQRVTLIETRQRLGGRATSFQDAASGATLDNCQHVLMGCCTHLIDLYQRLGVEHLIQWHRRLNFLDGRGRLDVLEGDGLPAPLHLARSLLRFRGLTWREKFAIARGMFAMIRAGRGGRERLGQVSFAHWLKEHRQPASAIRRFWSVIVESACNEPMDRVAAKYALQVFQEGMLAHPDAYVMGLAAAPLVELYDPAQRQLQRCGGRLLLRSAAERLLFDAATQRVTAVRLTDGRTIEADVFVSALPPDRLAKVCDDALRAADFRLRTLHQFEFSPIIGIHLFFQAPPAWGDRPIMALPHVVLMDSPLQWVFCKGGSKIGDRGSQSNQEPENRSQESNSDHQPSELSHPKSDSPQPRLHHLHGVISAAHALVDQPAQEIAALAEREIRKALKWDDDPAMRGIRLAHHRVVKEKRATFALLPGIDGIRPTAAGPIGNLMLAGDWTATGWPATMEGAVRSGNAAAAAVLALDGANGVDKSLPQDLPAAGLYRLLSRSDPSRGWR